MELDALQRLIAETYGERDGERGVPATVAWLAEEVGELAQAVRKGTVDEQLHELGDVLAWLASLAEPARPLARRRGRPLRRRLPALRRSALRLRLLAPEGERWLRRSARR